MSNLEAKRTTSLEATRNGPPARTINPFFGVAVAAVLLSEALGARDILGVAVITAGILAVQLSRQKA